MAKINLLQKLKVLFANSPEANWSACLTSVGILLFSDRPLEKGEWQKRPITMPTLLGLIDQLDDLGLLETCSAEREFLMPWNRFYVAFQTIQKDAEEENNVFLHFLEMLAIPCVVAAPETYNDLPLVKWNPLRPALLSKGSLADATFSIEVPSWRTSAGEIVIARQIGPIVHFEAKQYLMLPEQWQLFQLLETFTHNQEKTHLSNQRDWGRIRKQAIICQAALDDYLLKTIVLTQDTLDLNFRKSQVLKNATVIEVIPSFQDAPETWLEQFDRHEKVYDKYDFVSDDGVLTNVILSPEVKTVLQEIKKYKGRRLAGSRAQAFMMNPFATLGESAKIVLSEEQIEKAKQRANITFDRFTPYTHKKGNEVAVGIIVEIGNQEAAISSQLIKFNQDTLKLFIQDLEKSLLEKQLIFYWNEYEFEMQGESSLYLQQLQAIDKELNQITYMEVYNLEKYSPRIEGIGEDKITFSPYIGRDKEENGWFPENLTPVYIHTDKKGVDHIIPATKVTTTAIHRDIEDTKRTGNSTVRVSGVPTPISLAEAEKILGTILKIIEKPPLPGDWKPPSDEKPKRIRKTLLIKTNIDVVDYDEQRRDILMPKLFPSPYIPKTLSKTVHLKEYQKNGVAKIQHLYRLRTEQQVRGVLLADEMGLGKTLQILTFMAGVLESEKSPAPMLVVAPVVLLENWQNEMEKFFPNTFHVLTVYGKTLKSLRVSKKDVDHELTKEGITNFLRKDWLEGYRCVLTTYETLRDFEFSFAEVAWSLMVCDEVQKIKNPNALISKAAKKQKAGFKIACTGTPVENTLADLWSLFDFVQPGLLGALNTFGRTYRKPIEIAEHDLKAKEAIEHLRAIIAPQLIHRKKSEVLSDLPPKTLSDSGRKLPISKRQIELYAEAVNFYKNSKASEDRKVQAVQVIYWYNKICTSAISWYEKLNPKMNLAEYRKQSPKLDWLLSELKNIQAKNEKAIVFCQYKDLQRVLKYYIDSIFQLQVHIVNGDTAVSDTDSLQVIDTRQGLITRFGESLGFNVIILSPLSVGYGVNIQQANHVIHYTRCWNPAKEDQASDRAWRIGQEKEVYIYCPLVTTPEFKTYDVKLDEILTKKRQLAGDMLNGTPSVDGEDFLGVDPDLDGSQGTVLSDEKLSFHSAMNLDALYFERLIAVLWQRQGYKNTNTTNRTGDYGVDVVAIKGNEGVLIQVKTSNDKSIGWDAVKEVVTGKAYYSSKYPGVSFELMAVTNQYFTRQAIEAAVHNQVTLLNRDELEKIYQNTPVSRREIY